MQNNSSDADKYYLCDVAYTHTHDFVAPFRNVRYWLADFRSGGRPKTKEELFNHTHVGLRNVIYNAKDMVLNGAKLIYYSPLLISI